MSERPNKSTLRGLLRKHNRAVTLVGAFVVFLTYVAKEGLTDYWKDTAYAVAHAEESFRSLGLFIELQRKTDEIENSLERIEDPQHGLNPDVRIAEERAEQVANDRNLAIADELLANLQLSDSEEASQLRAAKAKGQRYSAAISSAAQNLVLDRSPGNLSAQMLPLTLQGMLFEQDVGRVVASTRRKALDARERAERNYSRAHSASYGLYIAGWLLALIGRLYDARQEEGEN